MLQTEFVTKSSRPAVLKLFLFSPALLLIGSLLFYVPWSSPNAPAWVQAVGSIAAIIAAWLIPYQLERARARKQKAELVASVGWLALRVKNSFDHMASVVKQSDPAALRRWLFLSSPLDWSIHRDAAREFPLTGFTRDEISWLLSLRSITEFGLTCSETLSAWDFETDPNLAENFPLNDEIKFHHPQIEWVMEQFST